MRNIVKVYRSNTGISVQMIDGSKVLVGKVYKFKKGKNPIDQAMEFGKEFGNDIKKKGADKITYDRGKFLYHGRVKAFAEGMRASGINF